MKIILKLLLLTIFLSADYLCFADVDSLKVEFNNTDDSEEKLKIAYLIAKRSLGEQPDTLLKYLSSALKDSADNPNSENLANCLNAMGVYHFYKHNFDSVILYSSRALRIFLERGNAVRGINIRKNIALAQRSLGNYNEALVSLFGILGFYKKTGDTVRVAATLNDIGNTYSYLKDYQRSSDYQYEALKYLKVGQDYNLKGNIYNSLAYAYDALGIMDSVILLYEKSLELKLKGGNIYGIVVARNNLCTKIDYKKYPKKCDKCFQELLKDQKKVKDTKGIARTFINLSVSSSFHDNCSLALRQLDSAAYYLKLSNDIFLTQTYLKLLAKTLNKCGKIELAYFYIDSLLKLNDSVFEFQKQEEIFELDTKYQTQQKIENIKMLETENENALLKVQKQRWQIYFLIFFLLNLVVGGILAFRFFKQKQQKIKEQAIIKMREEERVRIARDMHDEIGAGLTRISFMSEQIKLLEKEKESVAYISKIIEQSRSLSKNLREIIWAIDPRNDKLSELLFYLRDYINEFSDTTAINCKIDFVDDFTDLDISSEARRNIFLALKEILNNIVKHSKAESVLVKFYIDNGLGFLIVKDSGIGFDENKIKKGVGLESIKLRTEKLAGVFTLESDVGKGTIISLKHLLLNTTKV